MARVLFEGPVWVSYGFIFVRPLDVDVDLAQSIGGQVNGLCGAAVPGALALITGLHTGQVPVRVEACDEAPGDLGDWEDVVEASLSTPTVELGLAPFQDWYPFTLPSPGDYRARYSASGMDAARQQDSRVGESEVSDRYLLQLWPAPLAVDKVLRQGSELAAYWHGVARSRPAPPLPPTPEDLAIAQRAKQDEAVRAAAARRQRITWRGTDPSPELLALGPRAASLARRDGPLAEGVARLSPAGLREVAIWAARIACEPLMHDDRLAWAAALDALGQGSPLPAPFDNPESAWAAVLAGAQRAVVVQPPPGSHPSHQPIAAEAAALAAILAAGAEDPVEAAVQALNNALAGSVDPDRLAQRCREYVATRN